MGTIRLGHQLPNTRPWRRVIGCIADGAGADAVARATADASMTWLEKNRADPGFARVVFLLAKVVLAARTEDFSAGLASHGMAVPAEPTLFDLTAGFAAAVRDHQRSLPTPHTDLGEIGWAAGVETLTAVVGDRAADLFATPGAVRDAVRDLSTQSGFSTLVGHLPRPLP